MKIFIYLCCIAHLLTVISARLRLTTPMPSALRVNDDVARQTSNIAEMIDFVNSFLTDDGRRFARRGRYGWFPFKQPMLRRFELPAVKDINLPPTVAVPNDEGTENQLDNRADTVRYQVIDNPEVIEKYRNKQKQKNNEKLSKSVVSSISNTSDEAKSFSTVENKLRYYHSKSHSTASNKSTNKNQFDEFLHTLHPNPLDSVQKLTTVKLTYRPSFPENDDEDDDRPIKDDEVSVTDKEISTSPTSDAKTHDDVKINNTIEIKKEILDNKAAGKDNQAGVEEEKTPIDDTKEVGQMKHELPLKTDKDNDHDEVTVNEEKSGSIKEYTSSKFDKDSNERPREDNVRTRDEDFGNDGSKNINVTADTKSEIDEELKERSWDTNKVPVESEMGSIPKLALRSKKKNNNHDYKEPHSIHSHKKKNENSREKRDRKKKDKNDAVWSKNEKNSNKVFKKRYNKVKGYDRMEFEWNSRHKQYDENDNGNNKGNQWDKNDHFDSRDSDSNKRDDDWKKRDSDWQKRDFDLNKRDYDWKKRDFDLNKRDNDWNERDADSNKRENDWNNRDFHTNKRDSDWNKRDTAWIKQDSYTYNVDRNNHVIRKQNDWDNKYSHTSLETDGDKTHERYEIVERKIKDGDDSRHSEI